MRLSVLVTVLLMPFGASAWENLDHGLHALAAGNYPLAEQQLRMAVAEEPRNPVAHFNLGSTLRALGRGEEAIAEFRESFRDSPEEVDRSNALYGIALTREMQGDPSASAIAWREYISFAQGFRAEQPAIAVAQQHLADAQRLAGQPIKIPGTKKAVR